MTLLQRLFSSKQESRAAQAVSVVFKNSGGGLFGKMRYKEAVQDGYQNLVWVYRCVRKIGEAVGSVPWKAVSVNAEGEHSPLPNHPLERLMNRPNPYCDRREFWEGWATYLSLAGNDFIEVVTDTKKRPLQLYHMRPDWVFPIPDPDLYLKGYELKPEGQPKVFLEPQDVLHFKYLDPLNEYRGMSPLAAAARTLQTENAIIGWNKGMLDNNAVPGGVLTIPAQTLVKEDRMEIRDELETEFSGDGNLHRPMVLWGGMEWKQLGLTQRDMDFLQQKRLNKYELCAVFGVPPQVVGANEDPTYSNYSVARLAFWEDLVILMLDWIQNRINSSLAPAFGPDVRVVYDISDVPAMRESFQQKVKTAETLWKMGWPINAVNTRLGLGFDPVPWGETAWMPANLVPVGGTAMLGAPGNDQPEDDVEDPDEGVSPYEDPSQIVDQPQDPNSEDGSSSLYRTSRSALGRALDRLKE